MKIGIDVRSFAQGKNTGVEEFAKGFLEALFQRGEKHEFVLFFNSWRKVEVDFSWATKYKNVILKQFNFPNKLLNFSLWFLKYPKLDKLCGGMDIFYMPNINFSAVSKKAKFFLTIHDLSFEHYSDMLSFRRKIWHFVINPRLMCKKADKIFAVSNFTKQDIQETYKISSKKVKLALNGLTNVRGELGRNHPSLIQVKEKYKLPFNFILYFGTIEPRKNILSLIKAFEMLKTQNPQLKHSLVIAGANGWKAGKIYDAIENSSFSDQIIVLKDFPQEDKEALFTLSSVFVYPSFFEGFGFPVLEAIACDVPTITSNSSSLPEVAGKNAILIDPFRTEEIVLAMKEILVNNQTKTLLLQNKSRYLQKFNWNNTADVFLGEIES